MDYLPPKSLEHLPTLKQESQTYWPTLVRQSLLAGQVEQETCPSLKSKQCWNPKAELKTSREYGFGLGQITITDKFNNFEEAKKLDKSISKWQYANRYDAKYQLRVLVLTDKRNYYALPKTIKPEAKFQMALAAYNGGLGGVLSERRLCAKLKSCDPDLWFDNVEKTSRKSKKKFGGYGQSFFDINRGYVRNIWFVRSKKYEPYLEGS